jgi:outer membrane protein TolC
MLLVPFAQALTLQEAVTRAGERDPSAVVAELAWRQAQLDSVETWAGLGPGPTITASRTWAADTRSDSLDFSTQIASLSPGDWFDAGEQAAQARGSRWTATATRLDAQYAAATLYYGVFAAEAALTAARQGEEAAAATRRATDARVAAGLESQLVGRSAELGLLQAQATTAQAEAALEVARARLSRAIEAELDTLEPPPAPQLPADGGASPWLEAQAAEVTAARLEHGQRIAELFPSAGLSASTPLDSPAGGQSGWVVTLGASWQFDGVIGPFVRERSSALALKAARVQYEGLRLDLDLGQRSARAQARAAGRVAEAAQARESLAAEALKVGQTRLDVGLASSLEVLRLQDELARARSDRVAAEFGAASSILEARRLAGAGFD